MKFRNENQFKKDVAYAINKNGIDNQLNVSDYILANVVVVALRDFAKLNKDGEKIVKRKLLDAIK